MKMLECVADEFPDLTIISNGHSIRSDCEECGWREWWSTCEEDEVEKYFTIALRHARVTGHRVSVDRSVEWRVLGPEPSL